MHKEALSPKPVQKLPKDSTTNYTEQFEYICLLGYEIISHPAYEVSEVKGQYHYYWCPVTDGTVLYF